MIDRLMLSANHWEQMRAHVQACKPLEGCGLLLGLGVAVKRVVPVANAARSPSRFRMDPAGQVSAFNEMEDLGLELVGIFHSHPADAVHGSTVRERPSETDVDEAAYPVVQVIWSRFSGVWQARGFWIDQGRIRAVALYRSRDPVTRAARECFMQLTWRSSHADAD